MTRSKQSVGQRGDREQWQPPRRGAVFLPADQSARKLLDGETLSITVDGEAVEISPDEVEVRAEAKEGFAVASEGAYLAALVTELTPDLIKEGLVREFVRRVQSLRKDADLDIADRINLYYTASEGLKEAIETHEVYIKEETLAKEITGDMIPEGLPLAQDEFDGESVRICLEKS